MKEDQIPEESEEAHEQPHGNTGGRSFKHAGNPHKTDGMSHQKFHDKMASSLTGEDCYE